MQVGTTQSEQSLIASIRVATQIQVSRVDRRQDGADNAVLLSIGRRIDIPYAQRVLQAELGQRLEAALENAGIQAPDIEALMSGAVDVSPEVTAKRILDFATSFFGAFQANHADQDGRAQIEGFATLIRGAVDEGFAQARDLLDGIASISGSVAEGLDRTYGLVRQGIDDFAEAQRSAPEEPLQAAETPAQDLLAAI